MIEDTPEALKEQLKDSEARSTKLRNALVSHLQTANGSSSLLDTKHAFTAFCSGDIESQVSRGAICEPQTAGAT